MPKANSNSSNQGTGQLPPMDVATLYAGGDFSYLDDDRSLANKDDTPPDDDALPEPEGDTTDGDDDATNDGDESDDTTDTTDTTDDGDDGDEPDDDSDEPAAKGKKKKKEPEAEDDDNEDNETIPRWRLNQETKKRRQAERERLELERELEAFRNGKAPKDDTPRPDPAKETEKKLNDLRTQREKLRDEYEVALIDGDTKKSKIVRAQIDALDDQIFETRVDTRAQQVTENTTTRTQIETELQRTADSVAKQYDAFNPEHEYYDEDMVSEVVAYRNALMQQGRKPGEALQKAADTIAMQYGVEANGEPTESTTKPKDKKRTEQRSKGKEKMKGKQPPKMPGQRNSPKKPDITSMTDAEFDKLSPEERAKLRGDYRLE